MGLYRGLVSGFLSLGLRYVVDMGVCGVVNGSLMLKNRAILSACAGCPIVMYVSPSISSYAMLIPMKCSRLFTSILYFCRSAA